MAIAILPVNAGDLIRADLMNQILAALAQLDNRVTALEVIGPSTGTSVVITNIIPNGPVRIGEQMEILGQNFGYSTGGMRLYLDGLRILGFLPGTTDQHLIFQVPVVPNVPDGGKAVLLSLSNQTSTANQTVVVLPQQIPLGGNADVSYQTVTPATVAANAPATFRYKVKSRANQNAIFNIQATVSGVPNASDWQNVVAILNDDETANLQKTISLAPSEEKFFKVRLTTVPSTPANATFILAVAAGATGVVATPDSRGFTVGQVADQQDQTIDLNYFGAVPPSAFSNGTIQLAPGGAMKVVLIAQFHTAQTLSYTLTQGVVSGSGWTIDRNTINTPATISIDAAEVVGSSGAVRNLEFIVQSQPGSANSGQVFFQLLKQGATVPRKVTLNLGRPSA